MTKAKRIHCEIIESHGCRRGDGGTNWSLLIQPKLLTLTGITLNGLKSHSWFDRTHSSSDYNFTFYWTECYNTFRFKIIGRLKCSFGRAALLKTTFCSAKDESTISEKKAT